jgi:hypothetical protein
MTIRRDALKTLEYRAWVVNGLVSSLSRYLDYCSEMLSITGKIAALYIQDFDDDVALAAVNEVENLTTGLSRKVWQKLMIVFAMGPEKGGA